MAIIHNNDDDDDDDMDGIDDVNVGYVTFFSKPVLIWLTFACATSESIITIENAFLLRMSF